jgi:hypothetical protein
MEEDPKLYIPHLQTSRKMKNPTNFSGPEDFPNGRL